MMDETIAQEAVDDILSAIYWKDQTIAAWAPKTRRKRTWIKPTFDRDDSHLHVELLYRKSKV